MSLWWEITWKTLIDGNTQDFTNYWPGKTIEEALNKASRYLETHYSRPQKATIVRIEFYTDEEEDERAEQEERQQAEASSTPAPPPRLST
jgi:hypothetical protein